MNKKGMGTVDIAMTMAALMIIALIFRKQIFNCVQWFINL